MVGSAGWHGGAVDGPQTLKDGSDPKGQGLGAEAVRTRADWLVIALRQMDHSERPKAGRSRPPSVGIKQSGKATFA